jgi:hypothetical protein
MSSVPATACVIWIGEKISQPFCGVVCNLWNGNWVAYLVQGRAPANVARSDRCAGAQATGGDLVEEEAAEINLGRFWNRVRGKYKTLRVGGRTLVVEMTV